MISRIAALVVLICTACSAPSTSPTPSSSASGAATPTPSPALSTEWTEYHRDAARSGLGPDVPALAGPKVAWTVGVDGDVYASPLIVAGHVIIATENNTVYSLDLFTGAPLWKIHLGQLRCPFDDLLIDVTKAQALRHRIADVLAAGCDGA